MNWNNAAYVPSAAKASDFLNDGRVQIAMAGRSNVGKSSVINRLLNRKNLARVGNSPGKTRQVNYFLIDDTFYLVDLPGYGYARVSRAEKERWGRMMEDYFRKAEELRHVLCLVDIRHEPTEDDKTMNSFLRQMDIPFTVVATKADKIKASELVEVTDFM